MMAVRDARVSVFKQSTIVLVLGWLLAPLNSLTGALVARAIGPEGIGVLLLLTGLSGVLLALFSLGLPSAAAYFYKQQRYTLGQIMMICLALALLSTLVATLLLVFLSDDFIRLFMGRVEDIAVQPIWIWLTLAGLLPGLISPLGDVLLIVDGSMKLYTLKNMGGALLGIALTWLLVLALRWGIVGVLWSQLLALFMPMGVLVYWMFKKRAWASSGLSWASIKDMLHVGLQQYGVSLVAMVAKRFDTFLIAGMLDVREAGYFSIAYTLFNLLANVPRATMWPLVSRLAGRDGKDYTHQLTMASRIQFALMLVLMLGMGIITPLFIRVFYGDSFLPGTGAVWAILPAIVVVPLIVCSSAYFTSQGKPGVLVVPAIVATVAQVVTSITLMPRIGIIGNALGFTVNQVVVACLLLWSLSRQAKIRHVEMLLVSRADVEQVCHYGVGWLRHRLVVSG